VLRVKGKVFSGSGEGAKFIQLPWVKTQIAEKLGFIPYPGTLNIKTTEGSREFKKLLKKEKTIEISPIEGFCRGRCFNAILMNNLKCAIIVPEIPNYTENTIEVIAQVNLREKFKLRDGDVIEVKIVI
jgi:riboflavin kinase